MLEKNSSVLTLKLAENDFENEGVQAGKVVGNGWYAVGVKGSCEPHG